MRTIETTLYRFDELSDHAKERAREWWRKLEMSDPAWSDESRESIEAFCNHFGVPFTDWTVDAWSFEFTIKPENHHFRGLKLRDFNRDNMPTGYCLDYALWQTFHDVFKATGDAKRAFREAVYAGFKEWRDDIAASMEDENVDEAIRINEYEFMEDGDIA